MKFGLERIGTKQKWLICCKSSLFIFFLFSQRERKKVGENPDAKPRGCFGDRRTPGKPENRFPYPPLPFRVSLLLVFSRLFCALNDQEWQPICENRLILKASRWKFKHFYLSNLHIGRQCQNISSCEIHGVQLVRCSSLGGRWEGKRLTILPQMLNAIERFALCRKRS